jgi:hypothetical protein
VALIDEISRENIFVLSRGTLKRRVLDAELLNLHENLLVGVSRIWSGSKLPCSGERLTCPSLQLIISGDDDLADGR